ncbi:hypothetical protein [Stenotrophomonas sp.]|uniref:hypothetical protein n=1 Tax=Stenotrophomonas sp. TaxID=69392 RepID=UPI0028AE889F|nr:hypothetical protein [Stenotrophomonas sp.]
MSKRKKRKPKAGRKKRAASCLILRGTWLRDVGFSEGTPMDIEYQGHRIILTAQGCTERISPGTPTSLEREVRPARVGPASRA